IQFFSSTTRMELRWRATITGKLMIGRTPRRKRRCVPAACNRPTIWNQLLLPAWLRETIPPLSWERTTLPASPWLKSIICFEPDNRCVLVIVMPPPCKERGARSHPDVWHLKETKRKEACQHKNIARHAQFDIKPPITIKR